MKNPLAPILHCVAVLVIWATGAGALEFEGRSYEISDLRAQKSRPGPILIALPTDGASIGGFRSQTGLNRAARALNAMVVYPLPGEGGWDHSSRNSADVAFLARLVDAVRADPRTLDAPAMVVGHGAGGAMALRLACSAPDRVAGLGIVSTKVSRAVPCTRGRPKPTIFVHGTADPVQDHDGGPAHLSSAESVSVWTRRNGCSTTARVRKTDQIRRDRTSVVVRRYTGCRAALDHVLVLGGGHGWPNGRSGNSRVFGPQSGEIDASTVLIRFLAPLVAR